MATNRSPYFSILIPSYNRPHFITACIDSIINSDYQDYEIIISDDNSPKVEEIQANIKPYLNDNIHFFRQKDNLREPGNKNFLVSKAIGQCNIILGDDDLLLPNALSKIKKHIDKYPGHDLYTFGYNVIDEKDKFIFARQSPNQLTINSDNQRIRNKFFTSSIFPFWLYHPSIFCCKNGIEKNIGYNTDVGIGEDIIFMFDLINSGYSISTIPDVLFSWRKIQDINSNSQINQSADEWSNIYTRVKIFNIAKKEYNINQNIKKIIDSQKFVKTFLYDAILRKKDLNITKLVEAGLKNDNLNYIKNNYKNKKQYWPYVIRALDFISIFGLMGFIEMCRVLSQRIKYRFMHA
jgi:glycosyltransferase involved in cell wall biosynthesis